jgi:5,10-methylenetetrahydromethanopterin reductase
MPALGMKLDGLPTEEIVPLTRAIEQHGLDEVWICEDLELNGGIAQAAMALGATDRVPVGLGVAPAAVRNVAYFAMEVASLCRAFPGRFLPGLGHGEPYWLTQVGAHPGKLLPCLSEVTEATRRLLAGETVTMDGAWVHLDEVTLRWPPAERPPISLGVRGPKGVAIAAAEADGLILAEGSGPAYVAQAVARLGRPAHRITVLSWFSIDESSATARDRLRDRVTAALTNELMQAQVGHVAGREASDAVIEELTVSGTPDQCAAAINALYAAGADSVVLQAVPGTEAEQLALIQQELLPRLAGRV